MVKIPTDYRKEMNAGFAKLYGSKPKVVAEGMLIANTPLEDYRRDWGLWVKREDLSCPKPGPPFSKTRGVYAHVKNRPESIIGVLDTAHSQAGHAVARACQILGKKCINFYPIYKHNWTLPKQQTLAQELGAELHGLPAGRSCILFHAARKLTEGLGGYIMPNALKLLESVTETAKEVPSSPQFSSVIIPTSSGTIAAGVIQGFHDKQNGVDQPEFIVHLGYSRSHEEVDKYLREASGVSKAKITIIDEGYAYKDRASAGPTPPWPCNEYYDLKALRWWMDWRATGGAPIEGETLFWNIG